MNRSLRRMSSGLFEMKIEAKAFFAKFSQRSLFALDYGTPNPVIFNVSQKILGVSDGKKYEIQFGKKLASYNKKGTSVEIDVTPGTQDILSVQYMLRQWLKEGETEVVVPVVSKSNLKQYHFKITDRSAIQVPAGRFNAVKVERMGPTQSYGSFWFATDWDFMLLKTVADGDKGKIERMELRSGVIGGKPMVGL